MSLSAKTLGIQLFFCSFLASIFPVMGQDAYLDSLKNSLSSQTKADTSRLNTLLELVQYQRNTHFDEAEAYALEGLQLARKLGSIEKEATLLYQIGVLHYFRGSYDSAQNKFEQALIKATKAGDSLRMNASLSTLGIVCEAQNKDQQAMDYYAQSNRIAEAMGDYEGVMINHTNLGKIHDKLLNLSEATRHYREAIRIGVKHQQERMLGDAYNNLALMLKDNPDSALHYLRIALDLYEKHNNQLAYANVLNNMGGRYEDKDQPIQARAYFQQAFDIMQRIKYPYGKASAATNLGGNYRRSGELERAIF